MYRFCALYKRNLALVSVRFSAGRNTTTGAPSEKPRTCTAPQIRLYLSRISGPLLDCINIHIEVPRLSSEELTGKRMGESSATARV